MWEASGRWGSLMLAFYLILSLVSTAKETKKPSLLFHTTSTSSIHGRHSTNPTPSAAEPMESILQTHLLQSNLSSSSPSSPPPQPPPLEYDFYRSRCPQAEGIIQSMMSQLYSDNSSVAPAVLRLAFHDCFIQGCDASVLLGRINNSFSERDAIPNQTLKGFDAIEAIKFRLEAACPATVSCADVLVLAARNAVVLAGGPFFPLLTGRKDSEQSYFEEAEAQIPFPSDSYNESLSKFAARGFTERETVALLGAHSIGRVNCRFFLDRLYNFSGTGAPDGSLDAEATEEMRAACGGGGRGAAVEMGGGGRRPFDGDYYRQLLQGRGIMRADQQLTAGRTVRWVREYADEGCDARGFRGDFARAMAKLFTLGRRDGAAKTGPPPVRVRRKCSEVE